MTGPILPTPFAARFRDEMDRLNVPGLSLALVRGGEIVSTGAFGVSSRDSNEPVTVETVFQAASLSKPAFAHAVLGLVEAGRLDLDAPLDTYLLEPYLPADPRAGQITARHVLSHTSGLPNWRPPGGPLEVGFTLGTRFGYSGEGYVYLQRAVENLTGEPLGGFMEKHLLGPLGMTDSSFAWREDYEATAARGHDRDGKSLAQSRPLEAVAAHSLHTTPADYARLVLEVMHPRLLPLGLVDMMLEPQIALEPGLAWGLGWGLEGEGFFWHWGDNPGFKNLVLGSRASGDGLVVMTNGDRGLELCAWLVREWFGGDHSGLGWVERWSAG